MIFGSSKNPCMVPPLAVQSVKPWFYCDNNSVSVNSSDTELAAYKGFPFGLCRKSTMDKPAMIKALEANITIYYVSHWPNTALERVTENFNQNLDHVNANYDQNR